MWRDTEVIEIVPLAYMRGRTFEDAFILLDEAQNTTPEQMKMFLTRMGNGSKAAVTGDVTQTDLSDKVVSGLVRVEGILKDIPGIVFHRLGEEDVVRHPLVKRIIRAYDDWDKSK
jgi:phosphate starvation-inducible PhoH-like protein